MEFAEGLGSSDLDLLGVALPTHTVTLRPPGVLGMWMCDVAKRQRSPMSIVTQNGPRLQGHKSGQSQRGHVGMSHPLSPVCRVGPVLV